MDVHVASPELTSNRWKHGWTDEHLSIWYQVLGIRYMYMIHVLQQKSSRTLLYLEDIPDHPDQPDVYQDEWSYHHSTEFVPRFPKIYDT